MNRREARSGDFAYSISGGDRFRPEPVVDTEASHRPVARVRVPGSAPGQTYERVVTAHGGVDAATMAVLRRLARQGLV